MAPILEKLPQSPRRDFSAVPISTHGLRMFPCQSRGRTVSGSDCHRETQNVMSGGILGQTTPFLRGLCKRYPASCGVASHVRRRTSRPDPRIGPIITPTREQSLEPQGQSSSTPARCPFPLPPPTYLFSKRAVFWGLSTGEEARKCGLTSAVFLQFLHPRTRQIF
ncbi:hypothetical protein LZ31DRAFT_26926 [Colletotrichum somersetense]|nr:hypothetical protein LZ31DRAFT_26926 [Colletotrichum somersetense]